jgi:hypothetical protein
MQSLKTVGLIVCLGVGVMVSGSPGRTLAQTLPESISIAACESGDGSLTRGRKPGSKGQ